MSPLALDCPFSEAQNSIPCSVSLEHIYIFFSLEFFSPFGVYMNWLNLSRGESMFIFAEALPGEVLFVQRSPHLLGLAAAPAGVSAGVAVHIAGPPSPFSLLSLPQVSGSWFQWLQRDRLWGRVGPSSSPLIFNPTQSFFRLVCLFSWNLIVLQPPQTCVGRLGLEMCCSVANLPSTGLMMQLIF